MNPKINNSKYEINLKKIIITIFIQFLLIKLSGIKLYININNKLHIVNVNVFINKEFVYAISYTIPIIDEIIINEYFFSLLKYGYVITKDVMVKSGNNSELRFIILVITPSKINDIIIINIILVPLF